LCVPTRSRYTACTFVSKANNCGGVGRCGCFFLFLPLVASFCCGDVSFMIFFVSFFLSPTRSRNTVCTLVSKATNCGGVGCSTVSPRATTCALWNKNERRPIAVSSLLFGALFSLSFLFFFLLFLLFPRRFDFLKTCLLTHLLFDVCVLCFPPSIDMGYRNYQIQYSTSAWRRVIDLIGTPNPSWILSCALSACSYVSVPVACYVL
jgi:hypothetical protein